MNESEVIRCSNCRHEYEAREVADYLNCPKCKKIDKSKPLDRVFETLMPWGSIKAFLSIKYLIHILIGLKRSF